MLVDRDCNRRNNEERAQGREQEHPNLLSCLAVQEVEVWMLALHPDCISGAWSAIRLDCDPKERYCDPLLDALGRDGPGRGRKRAMRALAGNWPRLQRLCPEVADLRRRLESWLTRQGADV